MTLSLADTLPGLILKVNEYDRNDLCMLNQGKDICVDIEDKMK